MAESYEVETAHTAATAILALDQFKRDVVLLDLRLAEGSGMDVLAEIKTRERPPVVLLVSQHEESAWRALEAGAAEFHRKPIDTRALAKALARERDGGDA